MAVSESWQNPAVPRRDLPDRQRRRRAFQAARRHSRLVRRLRVLLPVAGLSVVLAFVAATRFALPENLDLSAARLSVTPSSIIMERPHLKGFDRKEQEFSVKAERAIQALRNPNAVQLETIVATMGRDGKVATTITAESGDYDRAKNTLQLRGKIAVDSAEGYAVRMTDAEVDLGARTLVSPNPVSLTYGEHTTSGNSVSVTGGGKVIVLQGEVRTTLIPDKRKPAPLAPAQEQVQR
jgi:lipopolysaccharide export system protein LptC